MIDLRSVQYHNSPSIAEWSETSELREVSWSNGVITIRHSKSGVWTPVQFETTTQEATLWLFLFYGGQWHGAGAERIRPAQTAKALSSPFDMTGGWLYDESRWGSMANRVLLDGERVGFCVTSGDMRSQMNPGPRERTNVRTAIVTAGAITLEPTSTPIVVPPQQPTETTPPVGLDLVLAAIEDLKQTILTQKYVGKTDGTISLPAFLGGVRPYTVNQTLEPKK